MRFLLPQREGDVLEEALMEGERGYAKIGADDPVLGTRIRELDTLARSTIHELHELCPDAFEPGFHSGNDLWAQILGAEMHHLINTLTPARRVTVVADREPHNLHGVIDYANRNPSSLQMSGIITPFHDLDDQMFRILNRIEDIRQYGVMEPPDDDNNLYASGPHHDLVPHLHVPYDKEITKNEDKRRRYCEDVFLPAVLRTNPDVVFLANWKLILDPIVPQELERRGIKLINCHPSVLPLNKGWRTELMALKGENPHASGFTYHYAGAELDGGATLLSYHYPANPFDAEHASARDGKQYIAQEEERMRLMMIRAQEFLTPRVLDYASGTTPQYTINGDYAFGAEMRSRPEGFDENYSRVLFRQGERWNTLEEIIGAPSLIENHTEIGALRTFSFFIPCLPMSREQVDAYGDIYREAGSYGEGKTKLDSVRIQQTPTGLQCEVTTASPTFSHWLIQMGYLQNIEEHPTRVTASRKPDPRKKFESRIIMP
jgi:folate-dependent phosphoribosylglycinamide formyltransferase PurN